MNYPSCVGQSPIAIAIAGCGGKAHVHTGSHAAKCLLLLKVHAYTT